MQTLSIKRLKQKGFSMQEFHLPQTIADPTSSSHLIERLASLTTGYTPDPKSELEEPSYSDYPVLKEPVWKWEIIWYFFFGGLTSGCYVLASIASLFGPKDDRAVARSGYYLSLLMLLPCPLLLIKDLGRPERFLHMLRVCKVKSPMSMGTWGLVNFSLFSGITAVIQAARDGFLGRWWGARLLTLAGTGLGLFLGGYTGVLLTATSVPLWSRSKLLGAVLISSAISTGSALISLVLRIAGVPAQTLHKLERMEWTALLVEMIALLALLRGSGRAAHALVGDAPTERGRTFWRFVFGCGLLLPWLLQTFSLLRGQRANTRRNGVGFIISLLVLMGGYFLRRTMIRAGHASSRDARTTLWKSQKPHSNAERSRFAS
jgi:formate-dependent nitrite reductase membrane component NrfD